MSVRLTMLHKQFQDAGNTFSLVPVAFGAYEDGREPPAITLPKLTEECRGKLPPATLLAHPYLGLSVGVTSWWVDGWASGVSGGNFPR